MNRAVVLSLFLVGITAEITVSPTPCPSTCTSNPLRRCFRDTANRYISIYEGPRSNLANVIEWWDAHPNCKKCFNTSLASVHNESEFEIATTHRSSSINTQGFWTGGYYMNMSTSCIGTKDKSLWRWLDCSDHTIQWDDGQPNKGIDEGQPQNYLVLQNSNRNGLHDTSLVDEVTAYLCNTQTWENENVPRTCRGGNGTLPRRPTCTPSKPPTPPTTSPITSSPSATPTTGAPTLPTTKRPTRRPTSRPTKPPSKKPTTTTSVVNITSTATGTTKDLKNGQAASSTSPNNGNGTLIAAGVSGAVLGICALCLVVYCLKRKTREDKSAHVAFSNLPSASPRQEKTQSQVIADLAPQTPQTPRSDHEEKRSESAQNSQLFQFPQKERRPPRPPPPVPKPRSQFEQGLMNHGAIQDAVMDVVVEDIEVGDKQPYGETTNEPAGEAYVEDEQDVTSGDMEHWTSSQVQEFVSRVGRGSVWEDYGRKFRQARVDGLSLQSLRLDDLRQLGVAGHHVRALHGAIERQQMGGPEGV